MATAAPIRGTVVRFDADAGYGEVADLDGRQLLFHCTAIADGSRMIDPGVEVVFTRGPGGPGRWEAFAVQPIG